MTSFDAPIAVAITGASGAQYGLRLIQCLLQANREVHVMISKAALLVIATESSLKLPSNPARLQAALTEHFDAQDGQLRAYGSENWFAPAASGSGNIAAMVICPCSTGTLSAVATGASNNLIERAADVMLKERRTLIMVPRETPLSAIHLQNMLTLTQMGATIMPASPGFYHQPQTIDDLVDFMVARVLSHLEIPQTMITAWGDA